MPLNSKLWPDSPWMFNRSGKPIKDTREVWDRSIVKAGINRLTLYDMRRTAVCNMRRAGIPQVIHMKISGHKTDSMERRYNIVDDDDLAAAKKFMEARQQALKSAV